MESEAHRRKSVRQATTRKRGLYLDPDTDDEFAVSDHEFIAENDDEPSEPVPKKPKTATRQSIKQTSRATRSSRKPASKNSPPTNRKPKDPTKLTKQGTRAGPPIPSDGVIPKWQNLPYAILLQVFKYAFAAELRMEEGNVASRRVHHPNTWIMRTARGVCHTFVEPALTAFYTSPNILAPRWLDDLFSLVQQQNDQVLFSYGTKVKHLEVSARHLESHGRDKPSLLAELVAYLPLLSSLVITHPLDEAPFEIQGRRLPRWKYPPELFEALGRAKIRLERWRWNFHLVDENDSLIELSERVAEIHKEGSFQSLRHLSVAHLPTTLPISEIFETTDDPTGVTLGRISRGLPHLESLSFETCDCISTPMLLQLPTNLESIKFVNCMTLSSDMLAEFLSTSGHSLKELILDHNPSLDLAFLTTLRSTCPKLRVLKMDLYNHRENYFRHFAEPKYENLLLEDEIPTWPSTLQVVELVHLQKWGANAAQNLFRSLVESADALPDLRTLVLQAHINISWRDRAAFRDQWIERLRRVYQRYPRTPNPNLASLKAFRQWKDPEKPRSLSHVEVIVRRSSAESQVSQTAQNSDNESLSKRRSSRRIAAQETLQAPTPPSENIPIRGRRKRGRRDSDAISVVSGENQQVEEDWRNEPEKFIQGLCDVVDIRIDNQRPREEQYNESHFLDSEASGDEEWTEGAELEADEYAW